MKITKTQLKRIIKEELESALDEGFMDSIKGAFGKKEPAALEVSADEECASIKAEYEKGKKEHSRGYGIDSDRFDYWIERMKREYPGCLPDDA
jgi:hypothetical protein